MHILHWARLSCSYCEYVRNEFWTFLANSDFRKMSGIFNYVAQKYLSSSYVPNMHGMRSSIVHCWQKPMSGSRPNWNNNILLEFQLPCSKISRLAFGSPHPTPRFVHKYWWLCLRTEFSFCTKIWHWVFPFLFICMVMIIYLLLSGEWGCLWSGCLYSWSIRSCPWYVFFWWEWTFWAHCLCLFFTQVSASSSSF